MASPHVAGVAALVLQVAPTSTPSEVTAAILGGATTGEVTSAGTGSPDMLLHSLVSGDGSDGGVGGGDNSGTVPGIKELKGSAIVNNRNVWTATITATGDSDASTSGTWSGGTFWGLYHRFRCDDVFVQYLVEDQRDFCDLHTINTCSCLCHSH